MLEPVKTIMFSSAWNCCTCTQTTSTRLLPEEGRCQSLSLKKPKWRSRLQGSTKKKLFGEDKPEDRACERIETCLSRCLLHLQLLEVQAAPPAKPQVVSQLITKVLYSAPAKEIQGISQYTRYLSPTLRIFLLCSDSV